jgi:hypothetical protein
MYKNVSSLYCVLDDCYPDPDFLDVFFFISKINLCIHFSFEMENVQQQKNTYKCKLLYVEWTIL